MTRFQQAALRLTVWYLAVLVLVSFAFSVALYRFASNEVARGVDRHVGTLQRLPFLSQQDLRDIRAGRDLLIEEGNRALVQKLAWFNLAVALVGGLAAYLLARRTLEPIEEAHSHEQRFVADASHELRTPLTVLRSELEVSLRSTKATRESQRRTIESSLEEVIRLERLTTSLLALSKGEAVLSRGDLEPVSVSAVVEKVVKRLGLPGDRVRVEVDSIRSEPTLLLELLTILIDNAVKYGANAPVCVRTKLESGRVVLEVENEGSPLAPEVLENAFERFYRGDSSRSSEGAGLGLSIAQGLARNLGGTIRLKNTRNGVLAQVSLPQ